MRRYKNVSIDSLNDFQSWVIKVRSEGALNLLLFYYYTKIHFENKNFEKYSRLFLIDKEILYGCLLWPYYEMFEMKILLLNNRADNSVK